MKEKNVTKEREELFFIHDTNGGCSIAVESNEREKNCAPS